MTRRHHNHGPFGPWSFFGGGGQWGPPWGGPPNAGFRTPKARRGDVRSAILSVLADQPMNGYQIIQEIAERSGGAWKPSPGSIYPTLQQLEDEGLVTAEETAGRRGFHLTDEGRQYVIDHPDEMSSPWETWSSSFDSDDDALRPLLGQVAAALWQIMAAGTPEQQTRARDALADMRRRLYGILADEDDVEGDRA